MKRKPMPREEWLALLRSLGSKLAQRVRRGELTRAQAAERRTEQRLAKAFNQRAVKRRLWLHLVRGASKGVLGNEQRSYYREILSYQERFPQSLAKVVEAIPYQEPWHGYWSQAFLVAERKLRQQIEEETNALD